MEICIEIISSSCGDDSLIVDIPKQKDLLLNANFVPDPTETNQLFEAMTYYNFSA